MRAGRVVATVAVGVAAVVVGPLASPAGATVTAVTTGGNTVVVNAVGNESVLPGCSGTGKAMINSAIVNPPINCSAVIQLTVAGDSGAQNVYGQYLDGAPFSSDPKVVASLGDGADLLFETDAADNVDMGPGDDQVILFYGGAANVGIELNTGTSDRINYFGSPLADTITAVSTSTGATISQSNPDGGSSSTFNNAELLYLDGDRGNDAITSTGITAPSSIDRITVYGKDGDDTITDGILTSDLWGGPGANTLTGGTGFDAYWSESPTDTLNGGSDAVDEFIYDTNSLRSGGRTITGFTANDTFMSQTHQGDVTMRLRPDAGGLIRLTTSLTRTGQQMVPAAINRIGLGQSYVGATPHRGLADVVASQDAVTVTLPSTGGGIIDLTIPTGPFSATPSGSNLTVTSGYGTVTASNVASYRVHGPWTNKDQGFVHRAIRDLVFRFTSDGTRVSLAAELTAGTTTRATVADTIVDTDEYRGLDVDRVFVKYLRRASDPSGRTYWINSLREGKALWRFRAQLVGSTEYFTKAGSTNEGYVTRMYNDVLGRGPDPSGLAYWTGRLDSGAERGGVALRFINADETNRRVVDDQFLRFLDRYPTATEQAYWVDALAGEAGEGSLIRSLVASTSYYNRS